MPSDGNSGRAGGTRREGSFLARWSRRKHEVEHGRPSEADAPAETPVDPDAQSADIDADIDADADANAASESVDAGTGVAAPDAEAADAEADLPHPDTLDSNSDFSVYLKRRVSSAFRRAAMRRLFSSPEFNVRDGLDDYDEDYTQFQSLGNTVTAHMRHHAERQRQREQERAEQADRDAAEESERTAGPDEPDTGTQQDADTAPATDEQLAEATHDQTPAEDAPRPTGKARTATNRDTDDTT